MANLMSTPSNKSKGNKTPVADVLPIAPKRRRPGPPPGIEQTDGMRKGTESRRIAAQERREREARGERTDRLKMLIDGTLSVADLDTAELQRLQIKDALGAFSGGAQKRQLPPRLIREMRAELLRRGQAMLDAAYTDAVNALHEIVKDPGTRKGDRARAAQIIIERAAGRMPETVRIEKDHSWDETFEVVSLANEDEETG
jgi:hypothetical protein